MIKRLIDIMACVGLAVPALVLFVFAAWLLRKDGPGPILFKQTRVGRHETPFTLYKMRTMVVGTAEVASHEVGVGQITPTGKMLRRTKLDEIPQLWNVFKGDMSLVGPRPCLFTQTELIEERRKRGVFALKPGITGPAQIRNVDMSTPVLLAELDAKYLHNNSLYEDVSILIVTLTGKGSGDAAIHIDQPENSSPKV